MLQWKGGQGWLTVEWLAGLCCTRGLCMCPLVIMSGRYARVARPAEVRCGGAGGAAAIKGSSIAIDETSIAVASSAPYGTNHLQDVARPFILENDRDILENDQ